MSNKTDTATASPNKEVVLTRIFDAPRELVFKVWTEPRHLAQWWGPHGFTNPVCEVDPRVGGALRIHMRGPDGMVYPMLGVFQEVVEPERLAFLSSAPGPDGTPLFEILTTVTFADEKGKTKLTVHAVVLKATPGAAGALAGMEAGWSQSLERLADMLASDSSGAAEREFVVTRVLDAPRDLVFRAWTEPERLEKWWGPVGFTVRVVKLDLRPGGTFLYSMRVGDNPTMWGKFVYREIVPPERLVFVVSFTDEAGNPVRHPMSPTWPLEVLSTLTLTEKDGKTTLTMRGVAINANETERRTFEGGFAGMQQGWKGTLDRLAEALAKA